jgi:hypothetical protein
VTDGREEAGDVHALLAERLDELARQVSDLARRVTTTEAGVQGLGVSVAEAAGLAREVERLSGAVAGSDGGQGPAAATRHPRVWAAMKDDQYREALRDLSRWVTTVLLKRYRYTAAVLPPCWPVHPEAVEELDWLYWEWTGWAAPADGEGARSRDAADWHDRWLPGVMGRLTPMLKPCAERGNHVPPRWIRKVPENMQHPQHPPEAFYIEQAKDLRGERS